MVYTLTILFIYHGSVRQASSWIDVDVEELFEDYPDRIFDSSDIHIRTKMTEDEVHELPQVDDAGKPIHLYCDKGYPIQRRMASFRPEDPSYGVLIKSENLQTLFTHSINDSDNDDGEDGPHMTQVPFTFYPQAGLRTVGHFQANGLIAPCYPILAKINKSISAASQPPPAPREDDVEMDDEDLGGGERLEAADADSELVPQKTVVHPISSQGYNAVTHNTRGRTAQHHEVQTGRVTCALAGAWATGHANTNIAYDVSMGCDIKLPHDAFADKIKNPEISRDLRLENVYWIDMNALSMDHRDGGSVGHAHDTKHPFY